MESPLSTPRQRTLSTKVTYEEYALFERVAGAQTVSAWARVALLRIASARPIDEVIMAEVLALRTILLNLQFAVSTGSKPSVEEMRRLIARADGEKAERARKTLGWHVEPE